MKVYENKKVTFDYDVLDRLEAGIVLTGIDASNLRQGRVDLTHAYVKVINHELFLVNAHIGGDEIGTTLTSRSRKLLVSRQELVLWETKVKRETLTILPLRLYNTSKYYKVEIGLCRSRKKSGKKEVLKKRDIKRDIEREFRGDKDNDNRR
jgi:SsrA-binding protein